MSITQDPIVRDAVLSRQIKQNFDAEAAKRKEKNDGSYSDVNYQYSLEQGGYQDYMAGKTNKLSNLSYIPYIDLKEKHLKELKTIKDLKGKRVIKMQDPNDPRQMIEKSIDGLTDSEIKEYFQSNLSPEEKQQMTINGWAKYGQKENIEQARSIYTDYNNQIIKNKEKQLEVLAADEKNVLKGQEYVNEARKKREAIEYEIKGLKSIDATKLDGKKIGYELEKAGYIGSLAEAAGAEWSEIVEKNAIHYADQELDIDRQNLALKEREVALKEDENTMKQTELKEKYGVDMSGNPLTDGVVAKSSKTTNLEDLTEEGAGAKSLRLEYNTAYDGIISTARELSTIALFSGRPSTASRLRIAFTVSPLLAGRA
jgi:hypothetical protein